MLDQDLEQLFIRIKSLERQLYELNAVSSASFCMMTALIDLLVVTKKVSRDELNEKAQLLMKQMIEKNSLFNIPAGKYN